MIRKIIFPTQSTYLLELPNSLIGKSVEILAFDISEAENELISEDKEQKLKSIEELLASFTFNSGGYKFDREDANDYE
jgi:hypothetical protein